MHDRIGLGEPVPLLGTAGTGKTTTLQAANQLLEPDGLQNRIVRCAYTGVAASNMGAGGRTLVSLFRLSKRAFGGGLEPLSSEDVIAMDEELRGMSVLEIDEVSMIEKLVLTQMHQRLQQWRLEVYHENHCRSKSACVCGARLPFGGVKLVLAGDFGQLPPVAVPPERTLLNPNPKTAGQDRQELGRVRGISLLAPPYPCKITGRVYCAVRLCAWNILSPGKHRGAPFQIDGASREAILAQNTLWPM